MLVCNCLASKNVCADARDGWHPSQDLRHQAFDTLITSLAPAACFSILQLLFWVHLSRQSQINLSSYLCNTGLCRDSP